MDTLRLTLKITTAEDVEMSVTATNNLSQDYTNLDCYSLITNEFNPLAMQQRLAYSSFIWSLNQLQALLAQHGHAHPHQTVLTASFEILAKSLHVWQPKWTSC